MPKYEVWMRISQGRLYGFRKTGSGKGGAAAKDLVSKGLLAPNPLKRFAYNQVAAHEWFSGVDWAAVRAQRMKPPFVPTLGRPGDTSCFPRFEKWEETDDKVDRSMTDREKSYYMVL
eukprot:g2563.t1